MQRMWIKLWRKFLDNEVLRRDDAAFKAFIYLLLKADKTTGEWSGGREQLALLTGQTPFVAYRAVKRLEKAGMVHRKVHSKYTVYRIENWHLYQGADAQVGAQQVHSKRTASAHSNKKEEVRNKKVSTDVDTQALARRDDPTTKLIDTWTEVHGTPPRGGNVKTHWPAKRLAEAYGADAVCKAIRWAEDARQYDQYIPTFNNFLDLEQKWNSLKNAAQRARTRRELGGTYVIE